MYALIQNGEVIQYPYSLADLRSDNPGTSFPKNPSEDVLAEWNVFPVLATPEPPFNSTTQRAIWGAPVNVDGIWIHTWEVIDRPQDEVDAIIYSKRQSSSLTPMQFRLNLLEINELDNVEAAVNSASREVQIMWDYATSFERLNPILLQLASELSYTDAQLDQIFGIS